MFSIFKKNQQIGTSLNLKIDGMHCTSCSLNIDGSLEDQEGIVEAKTSYAKSITHVTYDPAKISPQKIIQIIKDTGYQANTIEA